MFGSEVWNLKISFVAITNRTLLTQQATRERTSRRKILRIESKTDGWDGEKKTKLSLSYASKRHESRQIGSGQTRDGKHEHKHFRNQRTKMEEWVNLTQMTTNYYCGKEALEEMEKPSYSIKQSTMRYLHWS